jgi:hypothetical protein
MGDGDAPRRSAGVLAAGFVRERPQHLGDRVRDRDGVATQQQRDTAAEVALGRELDAVRVDGCLVLGGAADEEAAVVVTQHHGGEPPVPLDLEVEQSPGIDHGRGRRRGAVVDAEIPVAHVSPSGAVGCSSSGPNVRSK